MTQIAYASDFDAEVLAAAAAGDVVELRCAAATCLVHLKGATVLSVRAAPKKRAKTEETAEETARVERLWLSRAAAVAPRRALATAESGGAVAKEKGIRGGIPVCFPLFGPPPTKEKDEEVKKSTKKKIYIYKTKIKILFNT